MCWRESVVIGQRAQAEIACWRLSFALHASRIKGMLLQLDAPLFFVRAIISSF